MIGGAITRLKTLAKADKMIPLYVDDIADQSRRDMRLILKANPTPWNGSSRYYSFPALASATSFDNDWLRALF
jgi:hypothetical protein